MPPTFIGCPFKQSVQLEQQAADAQRIAAQAEQRVAESEQQAEELNRVLEETAASYQVLQQEHAATLDELAWLKRWAFGRRRERFTEGEGQGHLFELESALAGESPAAAATDSDAGSEVKAHRRRSAPVAADTRRHCRTWSYYRSRGW
jgi:hypothetical protein